MDAIQAETSRPACGEERPASPKAGRSSPAGSKTPESTTGCHSPGSPIGDDACPICLGSFTDKCAAGSCLHNFCLVCLKEWAKQRPVCPLCKQSFTKILYDIKSETDYKEWKVPVLYPNEFNYWEFRSLRQFYDPYERRISLDTLARINRRRNSSYAHSHAFSDIFLRNYDALPTTHRSSRHHQQPSQDRGTSAFRLSVYNNNIWIQPLADLTGRYRESSPQLYREHPALTHRLVPWINRELAALLPVSMIGVVLSEIMDLIERYSIDSREFRRALRQHLGSRTRHFVHEFYNFARSPYDMVGHDSAAQYIPHYGTERDISGGDDDDDDDDEAEVIEVESDDVLVELPLDLSSRVAREETIGNDGSVFISSDTDDANSLNNETSENQDVRASYRPTRFSSPWPGAPSILSMNSPLSTEERAQSLDEPGPSGVASISSVSVKREATNHDRGSSDSEDCLIVDVLKPKRERTPELIDLSSESEGGKETTKAHWKKRMNKQIESKDNSKGIKGRKRPRLDRTSFSLHFSGTLNCQRGEDHTYCTESASSYNPSSNRTESEEEDGGQPRNRSVEDQEASRKGPANRRRKWNLVVSDSDRERPVDNSSRRQWKPSILKQRRHYRTSSRRIVESSVSPARSPVRTSRKDWKSKAKNSSKMSKFSSNPATSKAENGVRSRQSPSCKRVYSSHSYRKEPFSSKNYKRHRHDSSSSASSSCQSSSSSSSSSSSNSSSSTSRSSRSSSSSSSSSRVECRGKSFTMNKRVNCRANESSRSESISSHSSETPSLSSSTDSEYTPTRVSKQWNKKNATKQSSYYAKSFSKNKKDRFSTKHNSAKSKTSVKKTKYK